MLRTFYLFILTLLPLTLHANGHELLSSCREAVNMIDRVSSSGSELKAGFCMGQILGMSEMNTIYKVVLNDKNTDISFCMPDKISVQQMTRDVVMFLENNPDDLFRPKSILINAALLNNYPCK